MGHSQEWHGGGRPQIRSAAGRGLSGLCLGAGRRGRSGGLQVDPGYHFATVEAPAAGESIEVPEELSKVRNELEPRDTQEDLGRFNVPAQFITRPDPMAVEGRTYNYDYIYRTER